MQKNIVSTFHSREDANAALEELLANGFTRNQVSLIASDKGGELKRYLPSDDSGSSMEESTIKGAEGGAALGGIIGLIAGIGAIALPGIGVVAGPIAGLIGGAAIGAAGGGLLGALVSLGIPENEAKTYETRLRGGDTMLMVHAPEGMESRAEQILNRHHASGVDYKQGSENLQGTNTMASTNTVNTTARTTDATGDTSMQAIKEEISIGKKEVETGGVRVKSYMTETPVHEQVQLRQEHVNVERRPVDRPASPEDFDTFKEGTIEMRETAEKAVVGKEARVVEEVVVSKNVDTRTEDINDSVRETHIDVEPLEDFRKDWQANYASRGGTFDDYSSAYSYGYRQSSDPRYKGRDWAASEQDLRTEWEREHPNSWDRYNASIRRAWDTGVTRRNVNLY